MKENGNEIKTMFWEDFSIAERFVLSAIQDTFNRAFNEWKDDQYAMENLKDEELSYFFDVTD